MKMKMIYINKILMLCAVMSMICVLQAQVPSNKPFVEDRVIVVRGDMQFPPFEYLDENGEPIGFNVDLFRAVAEVMNLKYDLNLEDWAMVHRGLEDKTIDVAIGMMYSTLRSNYVKFGVPHSEIEYCYISRSNVKYNSIKSLKGKEIIVQNQDWGHNYLLESGLTDKIIAVESIAECLTLLSSGKYDAAFLGTIASKYNIDKLGLKNLRVYDSNLPPVNYCMAINVDDSDLLYLLNMGLYQLKINGDYDKIYRKWLGPYELQKEKKKVNNLLIGIVALILLLFLMWLFLSYRIKMATREQEEAVAASMQLVDNLKKENKVRTETEQKLKHSERRFREIFNSSNEAIFIHDAATGVILDCNENALHIFGDVDKDFYLGHRIDSEDLCLDPEADKIYTDCINRAKQEGAFSTELQVRKLNGDSIWIEVNLKKTLINNEECIIAVDRDINSRKHIEHELIAAKNIAEEGDKLKTSFLANLSHEVRTPMNSIYGFASLLTGENQKDLIEEYASVIMHNSEQLLCLIDEIVLYSKLQTHLISLNKTIVPVIDVLHSVKKTFSLPVYQNGIELKIADLSDPEVCVETDKERLIHIFSNLVSNAFKYTESGSIVIGYDTFDGEDRFFVRDTGMGVPKDELCTIFDRFSRGSNVEKSNIKGSGLGLSIVKELVDLFGGKVWVESEIGKGSVFYFTINGDIDGSPHFE